MSIKHSTIPHNKLCRQASLIQQCLRDMIPKNFFAENNVCIAGSAPLQWLLLTSAQNTHTAQTSLFEPNDIDIFIFGANAKSVQAFLHTVDCMINNLKRKRHNIKCRSIHKNWYILENIPIHIVNVKVIGIRSQFSFVQCPTASTKEHIISSFDMDIVKVIYDIKEQTLLVDESIRDNAEHRNGVIQNFICSLTAPSNMEIKKISTTLCRMRKYSLRGFHFNNVPTLSSSMVDIMKTPPATTLPYHIPFNEPLQTTAIFRDVVNVMKQIIPKSYLESGQIGLFGELPLMMVLDDDKFLHTPRVTGPWRVRAATICVCGEDALSHSAFNNRMELIKKELSTFNYWYNYCTWDGILEIDTYTEIEDIRIRDIDVDLRFVRCINQTTSEMAAKAMVVGIERVWYDFRNICCHLCPGVQQQLQSGVVDVTDFHLKGNAPTTDEAGRFTHTLKTMQHYHRQGFLFRKYPTLFQH